MTTAQQVQLGLNKEVQRLQTLEIVPSDDNLIHQKFHINANNQFSDEVPMEKGLQTFHIKECEALDDEDDQQTCADLV